MKDRDQVSIPDPWVSGPTDKVLKERKVLRSGKGVKVKID